MRIIYKHIKNIPITVLLFYDTKQNQERTQHAERTRNPRAAFAVYTIFVQPRTNHASARFRQHERLVCGESDRLRHLR